MGIRVNKVAGWGTRDFKPPKNWDDRLETLYDMSAKEFIAWMALNKDEIATHFRSTGFNTVDFYIRYYLSLIKQKRDAANLASPASCCVHDDEFGIKGAIVFYPMDMKSCQRRDDLIDYLDESFESRWTPIGKGIYPFNKGEVPVGVIAICLFLGVAEIIPKLREVIYVYWG